MKLHHKFLHQKERIIERNDKGQWNKILQQREGEVATNLYEDLSHSAA